MMNLVKKDEIDQRFVHEEIWKLLLTSFKPDIIIK